MKQVLPRLRSPTTPNSYHRKSFEEAHYNETNGTDEHGRDSDVVHGLGMATKHTWQQEREPRCTGVPADGTFSPCSRSEVSLL